MLILDPDHVTSLLSRRDAMEAVERALRAQAEQTARFPLRQMVAVSDGILGAMPGTVGGEGPTLGAKLVTFFPENARLGRDTHQALIALFDASNGEPLALLDGRVITEMRTAAASAVATKALAPPGARTLAILGTGVQARAHARALSEVMQIEELRVWGRNRLHVQSLCTALRDEGIPARPAESVEAACSGAAVICTVTSATEPIVTSDAIARGTHLNVVGSSVPHKREIPSDLMALASIFVDSIDGALHEAGDITSAISDGALPAQPRLTLLADVIAGHTIGRTSPDEITLFKSLGIAIWDVACAALVYERARSRGIGSTVKM